MKGLEATGFIKDNITEAKVIATRDLVQNGKNYKLCEVEVYGHYGMNGSIFLMLDIDTLTENWGEDGRED